MSKAKDVHEFIAMNRRALAENPECGNSHYNLAVGLLGIGEYEEAEKALFDAIENSPTLAEAYVQLGGLAMRRGDLQSCLEFNQRATRVKPGFSEGWGNIGFVHMQRGEIDEAIKALEKATRFNFRYVQAYATLANAYLMKDRVDDAIETNLKVLKLAPDFAVAHNNLTIAYLEKNDLGKAREHCKKAQELGYEVAPEILADIESAQTID